MHIEALCPVIGARIDGVDLATPLAPATLAAIKQAVLDHLVVVFPGQSLTPHQYRDAMAQFGEPMLQHRAKFNLPECEQVSTVKSQGGFGAAVMWHTDHTNHEQPPKFTMLYGVEIPEAGGDTEFANMYAGLDALTEAERRDLAPMITHNEMEANPGYSDADRARNRGGADQPMVRLHPETGKPALYFHVSKATEVVGRPDLDTRPFLEDLLTRTISSANTYRHRWQKGDVVICDNRCTMHRAHADYAPDAVRALWRVIIRGERPQAAT